MHLWFKEFQPDVIVHLSVLQSIRDNQECWYGVACCVHCMFIDSCRANCLFPCNSTHIGSVDDGEQYVCLIFLHSCAHSSIRNMLFQISASGEAAMLASNVPARCCGTTKSGQRCSITSSSSMRGSLGRLVADPLRRGSAFCMLHTVLFRVEPAHIRDSVIVYMDLETNSLDVLTGKVVEIGALIEGSCFTFSTVVNPGQDESIDQPSVHGIAASELLLGPCFSEAFLRFDAFLRHAALSVLDAEDDSEDEQQMAIDMKPDQDIVLVAQFLFNLDEINPIRI